MARFGARLWFVMMIGLQGWAVPALADAPVGSICGISSYNIYNGWSATVRCEGVLPNVSCPVGYAKKVTAVNGGVDNVYTCVKSDRMFAPAPVGTLCGLSSYNIYNGWSVGGACDGVQPHAGCPFGYSAATHILNGGVDRMYLCVKQRPGPQFDMANGRLCGLENYNIYNGWSRTSACRGDWPSQRCPAGFRRSAVVVNGGIDTVYTCAAPSMDASRD